MNEIYIGSTNDLKRRMQEHNSGKEISTKRYMPWSLLYYEAYLAEEMARLREKRLKHNGNAIRELKKRIGLFNKKKDSPSTTFALQSLNQKDNLLENNNFSIAKKFKRESGAGFTLIELVIAIFVLSFATVGVYNAFSTVIVLTQGISNRFTAAYLAQEGLEVIRNMRDTNWIKNQDWKTGLDCSSAACEAYYKTGTSSDFPLEPYSNNGRVFKIDDNGFYNYTSGQDTKLKRKIVITPTSNPDAINVSVLVTWKEKDQECTIVGSNCCASLCIKAEEYLYNWY